MIVSKYSKSYDTADGSEQQHGGNEAEVLPVVDNGSSDRRWEDDGGSAEDAAPATSAGPDATKPAWSVQSVRHLLDAIRASKLPATAADKQERAQARSARAFQADVDRQTESDRIERDRYRNSWEHS